MTNNIMDCIFSASSAIKAILTKGISQMKAMDIPFFIAELPIDMLEVAEYQRESTDTSIARILAKFDYSKIQIKTVNYRNGVFYLIDGRHTMKVLQIKGYKTMLCRVFIGLTEAEEAALFSDQDEGCTRVDNVDKLEPTLLANVSLLSLLNVYVMKWVS